MKNQYFKQTTPEQRAQIRAYRDKIASQGYYPWNKAPTGFSKTRTGGSYQGLPTLMLNTDGRAIVHTLKAIVAGEIQSYADAQGFLRAQCGLSLTTIKLRQVLKNPNLKGLLFYKKGKVWVEGRFAKPMPDAEFDMGQAILSTWKGLK